MDIRVVSRGGDFRVRVAAPDASRYPMRSGQGLYQPTDVLLVWNTDDGVTWTFEKAVIKGQQIERTGEPGMFDTSQLVYLNDPTCPDCEPRWLAALVEAVAPGVTSPPGVVDSPINRAPRVGPDKHQGLGGR